MACLPFLTSPHSWRWRCALRVPAVAQQSAPQARAAGSYMNLSFVGLTDAGWSTEPDVGSLQLGDHDPQVRGFTIPNGELALDGTVDPYFKGFTNIVYKLDDKGETGVELEEMYFLTTSLPGEPAAQGRPVLRRVRPPEPAAPPRLGVCGPAAGAQSHVRPRGTAQPGGAAVLAGAHAVVRRGDGRACSTAPAARRSAFARTNQRRSTAVMPVERAVRRSGDLLIVPRIATSFDVTATQTLRDGSLRSVRPQQLRARCRNAGVRRRPVLEVEVR